MTYPQRTLISEPFTGQMETIEKAMIEVQSQPSSFYGRRNNNNAANGKANNMSNNAIRTQPATHGHMGTLNMGLAHSPSPSVQSHTGKTGTGAGTGTSTGTAPRDFYQNGNKYGGYYQQAPAPQLDLYGGTFRNTTTPLNTRQSPSLTATSGIPGLHPASTGGAVSMTPHIPQVFNDENVFSAANDSPVLMDAKKSDGLATFDPFGGEFSGYATQGSLFSPMFNSSSKILSSNYSSPSTNIWGTSSKSMAGDAAVWG